LAWLQAGREQGRRQIMQAIKQAMTAGSSQRCAA